MTNEIRMTHDEGAGSMHENPYEAPQVERSEAPALAEDSRNAQQFGLLDLRVLGVSLLMIAMAFGLPIAMVAIVSAWL